MNYQDEWLLYEAGDEIDEAYHRQPTEEFLFYEAVSTGNVEAVKKNCEANRLSFSSQSHFIQQFREAVGMTPKKYRDEHYMVQWETNESK